MKPAVKYVVMGGGALVLLFGSFVTFAALSGQPMHKIAILRNFVKAPDAPKDDGAHEAEAEPASVQPEPGQQGSSHSGGETAQATGKESLRAVERAAGMLGAFALPSPFSADELTDLSYKLTTGNKNLEARQRRIEQRERDLDDRELDLDQRQQELSELRQKLLEKEGELRMLSDEVARDTAARNARDAASWKELSKFFEEGEAEDLGKKLLSFTPAEAAKILRSLDDERASSIVNALPPARYKDYLDAYRDLSVKDGAQKKP
jgi:flagellar motility protein MotE (MotC chaperone)